MKPARIRLSWIHRPETLPRALTTRASRSQGESAIRIEAYRTPKAAIHCSTAKRRHDAPRRASQGRIRAAPAAMPTRKVASTSENEYTDEPSRMPATRDHAIWVESETAPERANRTSMRRARPGCSIGPGPPGPGDCAAKRGGLRSGGGLRDPGGDQHHERAEREAGGSGDPRSGGQADRGQEEEARQDRAGHGAGGVDRVERTQDARQIGALRAPGDEDGQGRAHQRRGNEEQRKRGEEPHDIVDGAGRTERGVGGAHGARRASGSARARPARTGRCRSRAGRTSAPGASGPRPSARPTRPRARVRPCRPRRRS